MYVCTQFRGNRSRDFGFRTRKPPRKFGVKSGLSQKRLKYGKKYFIWLYVSRYPFIPTNPLLAAMRFISFFFLFCPFFSPYLYALLLLNHNTTKSNFCVKLLSCKRNFVSRSFLGQLHREPPQNGASFVSRNILGQLHREPPQNGAPKNQMFERLKLARVLVVFDISRYLTDKYFDIVWGCHLPGNPPKWTPQKLIF